MHYLNIEGAQGEPMVMSLRISVVLQKKNGHDWDEFAFRFKTTPLK